MERWLSLTVFERNNSKADVRKPPYFISIPKKIVKQAVRRNRLKRVLREALRNAPFLTARKLHRFKVLRAPERVDLRMAREAVGELLSND